MLNLSLGSWVNSAAKLVITPVLFPFSLVVGQSKGTAGAKIVMYQDDLGTAWAKYSPKESRDGWSWEGGCVRSERLMKA